MKLAKTALAYRPNLFLDIRNKLHATFTSVRPTIQNYVAKCFRKAFRRPIARENVGGVIGLYFLR